MEKIVYRIALLFDILLFLLIATQMLRFWFDPFRWGWPSQIHPRVFNLLIVEFVFLISFVFVFSATRVGLTAKTIVLFALFVVNFSLFSFFTFINPFQKYPDVRDLEQAMDPGEFEALVPCNRVVAFAEIASKEVGPWGSIAPGPDWMHDSLEEMPKDIAGVCIAEAIQINIALVKATKDFNEEAVSKIYALTIEAGRLEVFNQPVVLAAAKESVCTKNADPFGFLALQYYPAVNASPTPDFPPPWKERIERMRNEICGE